MKTIVIIPARYASTRYPGKPLVELRGKDGSKSLVQRSYEAAISAQNVDAVFVATDDDRIAEAAKAFGADVIMTSEDCANGTERCADAIIKEGLSPEIVVNLQGDAPLTPPAFVEALIDAMNADAACEVATPVLACDQQTYDNFVDDRKADRVGGTTAVFGVDMKALYFSKEVIPFKAPNTFNPAAADVFHHVGLYAYRPSALASYMQLPVGPLEKNEGLEQLRFLENNIPIKCVEVPAGKHLFWELNNPEDVARIEAVLKS